MQFYWLICRDFSKMSANKSLMCNFQILFDWTFDAKMGNKSSKNRTGEVSDSFMAKLLVKELKLSREQVMILNQSSDIK